MHEGLLRAVGATTAVYGLAVTAWPALLAKPSGLAEADGQVASATRTALRPLAWRDAAGGLALALAPTGPALQTAACVRIAADFGDAALLGVTLPGRARRRAAVAVSVGWGALSVVGLLWPTTARAARGA
ncbi:hypothetical protein ADK86_37710 [Streptomyces sp. NRRL F-5755]|uniref:hypothetical protein n=1 Tax=Streptomyces sp. NRRL F-5755 TaxID=1519475 RepID=UPI0006AF56AE|nr:hypothetical protein [Streptomyces sp. NRRL F-5755]KOT86820.1 hypothetical protein ADK86_37710 [Streptomyces sp. NRRL F-5755]